MKICWMYHDLMDLYGDKGNIQVLKIRCEKRNIPVKIDTCTLHEEKDLTQYDLLFIGGGADKEQGLLAEDLCQRKENLKQAMEKGAFVLLICGGYQLFGKSYIDADGRKINGLGFYDYETTAAKQNARCIGNIAIDAQLDGKTMRLVGFENHGGQTINVKQPLGRVVKGHGNCFQSEFEGFYDGKVLGTYMHGPLLPKNPDLADFIIAKALHIKMEQLSELDDELEQLARNKMLERLGV